MKLLYLSCSCDVMLTQKKNKTTKRQRGATEHVIDVWDCTQQRTAHKVGPPLYLDD